MQYVHSSLQVLICLSDYEKVGGGLLCCITCLSHVYHVCVTLHMSRSHVRWWCLDCWTRSSQLSLSLPQSIPRCYHMSNDTGWRWMRFYYSMSRWDVSMEKEGSLVSGFRQLLVVESWMGTSLGVEWWLRWIVSRISSPATSVYSLVSPLLVPLLAQLQIVRKVRVEK